MECQVEKNEHFRNLLLFAFNCDGKDAKDAKAACEICAVYGEDSLPERTARLWFSRFKNKKFNLKDVARFCHIRYVRTSVVVLQKNAITSIRSLLMNRFIELMRLLNVEICIDRLVCKKFILNDSFPVPPHTQHCLPRMKFLFCSQCFLFLGTEPFFSLLHVDINTPFFVAGNDAVKKSLLVAMNSLVTSKQTGGNHGTLKFVVLAQSMWNPCAEFLDFAHRMKVFHYSLLFTRQLFSQFSG